jgi:hypothetical protein
LAQADALSPALLLRRRQQLAYVRILRAQDLGRSYTCSQDYSSEINSCAEISAQLDGFLSAAR